MMNELLYSNCCYLCINYSQKIKLLTYHKTLYLGFFVGFGHIYLLIFHMYSYTFIFKTVGFNRVFLLVSKKKCIKATVVF